MTLRALVVSGPKLSWRFSRELFKDAIELGQRLEADGERNFADPKIWVLQQIARFTDAYSCDVMDKIYAGNFFELFAQVIGADVDGLADFRK